jgi:hypothetical protein
MYYFLGRDKDLTWRLELTRDRMLHVHHLFQTEADK